MGKSVLISGAGIAGSTAAYWLGRQGFRVTVVERAAGQRSSGNPVDVKGAAVDIVERMGVLPRLREAASQVRRMVFVDPSGRERARVDMRAFQGSAGDREVEVARADLAGTLLSAAAEHAEIRWGDSISGLTRAGDGVDVTFERGAAEHFDLVVGADGLHSAVRRLAFGPESEYVRPLGMYVATFPVDRPLHDEHEVVMLNTPRHAFAVHPANGKALASFIFHHPTDRTPRDTEDRKRLIVDAYTPHLGIYTDHLDHLKSTPHLPTALTHYEHRHRKLVTPRQRAFPLTSKFLVPKTTLGITLRNKVIHLPRPRANR
ncbi:FAD-dependent oxidoreductase [Nocardia sp. NPDC003482]